MSPQFHQTCWHLAPPRQNSDLERVMKSWIHTHMFHPFTARRPGLRWRGAQMVVGSIPGPCNLPVKAGYPNQNCSQRRGFGAGWSSWWTARPRPQAARVWMWNCSFGIAKMVAGTICCRLKTGNGTSPSHYYSPPHLLVKTVIPNCILNTTAHVFNVHFMRLKKGGKKSPPHSWGREIQWRAA